MNVVCQPCAERGRPGVKADRTVAGTPMCKRCHGSGKPGAPKGDFQVVDDAALPLALWAKSLALQANVFLRGAPVGTKIMVRLLGRDSRERGLAATRLQKSLLIAATRHGYQLATRKGKNQDAVFVVKTGPDDGTPATGDLACRKCIAEAEQRLRVRALATKAPRNLPPDALARLLSPYLLTLERHCAACGNALLRQDHHVCADCRRVREAVGSAKSQLRLYRANPTNRKYIKLLRNAFYLVRRYGLTPADFQRF